MLQAYFDESERIDGTFCVAGYVFTDLGARRYRRAWAKLLAGRTFHAADLFAKQGEFLDVSDSDVRRLCVRAAQIINRQTEIGVSISCNLDEIKSLSPAAASSREHAYSLLAWMCTMKIGNWAKTQGERVAYFFEAGHDAQAAANFLVSAFGQHPDQSEVRELMRYQSHAFLEKTAALQLQAADFLAWECAKLRAESLRKEIRPPRRSFMALLQQRRNHTFILDHVEGDRLRQMVEYFDGLWAHVRGR